MDSLKQLQAELRATMRLMAEEHDPLRRRALLGECEHIEAAIAHEKALQEIASRYVAQVVRLVRR